PRTQHPSFPYTTLFRSSLLRLLTITDAGQHIGDRIGHTHLTVLLTSSPWSCRVLHRGMPCHEVCFGTDRTYGIHHADDPSVRSRSEEHTSELQSRENLV